jgi:predicted lipoprotein with Yx(FWY)xxD motif
MRLTAATLALSVSVAAGCALFQAAPAEYDGGVLVDHAKKMTLYTFDKDPGNGTKSLCNGPCAVNWPPFSASAADKDASGFSKVKRDDGTLQWAYKGKPLYFWVKDQKPGDRSGDGFNNIWRVAK